jgi:predicted AlkP superfamily pyrophosphatase or phosphodiesterase
MLPRVVLLLALLAGACVASAADPAPAAPVILVSVDGFHPDFLARGRTPTLQRLADTGTRAKWMTPAFPTLTFPNHYTAVTGLDPDEHGIVHNTMRDPVTGMVFTLSDRDAVGDGRWWGGVPVWVSAGRAGLRTAAMFWPGSEAEIGGRRPDEWFAYDERRLPGQRVDQVLSWLDRPPAQRPHFITLYFELVDTVGHAEGPRGRTLDAAMTAIDRALARLVDGLAQRGLTDAVNLVIISDHGMAETSPRRTVVLDRIVPLEDMTVRYWGTVLGIEPRAGREQAVERALLRQHRNLECWRKQDIPARLRYGRHPRVAPIVCLARTGWTVASSAWVSRNPDRKPGGAHGYDDAAPEMRALFIAHGPAFRRGVVVEPLETRDVYGVLMGALGLPPEVPLANPGRIRAVFAAP